MKKQKGEKFLDQKAIKKRREKYLENKLKNRKGKPKKK